MADAGYVDKQPLIVDGVHGAVVAYTNAPSIIPTLELLATAWPWIGSQSLQSLNNAGDQLTGQSLQFLTGAGLDSNPVTSQAASRV